MSARPKVGDQLQVAALLPVCQHSLPHVFSCLFLPHPPSPSSRLYGHSSRHPVPRFMWSCHPLQTCSSKFALACRLRCDFRCGDVMPPLAPAHASCRGSAPQRPGLRPFRVPRLQPEGPRRQARPWQPRGARSSSLRERPLRGRAPSAGGPSAGAACASRSAAALPWWPCARRCGGAGPAQTPARQRRPGREAAAGPGLVLQPPRRREDGCAVLVPRRSAFSPGRGAVSGTMAWAGCGGRAGAAARSGGGDGEEGGRAGAGDGGRGVAGAARSGEPGALRLPHRCAPGGRCLAVPSAVGSRVTKEVSRLPCAEAAAAAPGLGLREMAAAQPSGSWAVVPGGVSLFHYAQSITQGFWPTMYFF